MQPLMPPARARPGRAKSGRAYIGAFVDIPTGHELRRIAADHEVEIRALVARGIYYVLKEYHRPISPELQALAQGE